MTVNALSMAKLKNRALWMKQMQERGIAVAFIQEARPKKNGVFDPGRCVEISSASDNGKFG
eukprot:4692835-Karenia_brevis.AAC.1